MCPFFLFQYVYGTGLILALEAELLKHQNFYLIGCFSALAFSFHLIFVGKGPHRVADVYLFWLQLLNNRFEGFGQGMVEMIEMSIFQIIRRMLLDHVLWVPL